MRRCSTTVEECTVRGGKSFKIQTDETEADKAALKDASTRRHVINLLLPLGGIIRIISIHYYTAIYLWDESGGRPADGGREGGRHRRNNNGVKKKEPARQISITGAVNVRAAY